MKRLKLFYLIFFLSLISQTCYSFDWTSSNIQLVHGSDFEFGDRDRTTVTVEHAHGWKYGQNFFFVDVMDRNDIGVEVYSEVYSYLSVTIQRFANSGDFPSNTSHIA